MVSRKWVIGTAAAAVLVGGAGVATWATVSFFNAGPQPAQVLPADTVGYIAVDLSPSGGQKIEAVKFVNKFPALKKELNLSSTDDVRRAFVDSLTASGVGCDIDYDKDVEPWIGSAIGMGLVGVKSPSPVMVLEVSDDAKAKVGAEKILACDTSGGGPAFTVDNGWLMIGESTERLAEVTKAAEKESLADNADFKNWTEKAGTGGLMTGYISADLLGAAMELSDSPTAQAYGLDASTLMEGMFGCTGGAATAEPAQALGLSGAAMSLRFDGGSLKVSTAADFGTEARELNKGARSDVTDLPADINAVVGFGLPDGWVDSVVEQLEAACGPDFDINALWAEVNEYTGLNAPGDIEDLLGSSVQVIWDATPEGKSFGELEFDEIPVALRMVGDPAKTTAVVNKIGAMWGLTEYMSLATGDDSVTVALGRSVADSIAEGGKLGDSKEFTSVVSNAAEAGSVFYINADGVRSLFADELPGEANDNLEPLRSIGASDWLDGTINRGELVVSVK